MDRNIFGRTVIKMSFLDESGNEITVREIKEFKEVLKKEYLPDLIAYLENGRIEQFFYGHGEDDIKNMISDLKAKREERINILNAIAEKLGVPKITIDENSHDNTLVNIKDMKSYLEKGGDYKILPGAVELSGDVNVNNNVSILGKDKSKHLISMAKASISINSSMFRSSTLQIANVTINVDELVIKGNGTIEFKNVDFKGNTIKLDFKGNVIFSDCDINCAIDSKGAKININNSKLHEGEFLSFDSGSLVLTKSQIYSYTKSVSLKNSKFSIESCDIYGNGNEDNENEKDSYPQLLIIKSNGSVINAKIRDGVNSGGIYAISSEISIKSCEVSKNYHHGINIKENSKFSIEGCDIYGNGNEKEDFAQTYIGRSKGDIINSKIHDGVNNNGVHIFSSEISIKSCEVFKNYYNGINIKENSKFSIEDCYIYGNGNNNGSYPQLWIEKSNGSIIKSRIHDGINNNGINSKSSETLIKSCEVFKNYYNGINIKENSKFSIEDCYIYGNGNNNGSYPQLWIEKSNCIVINSKVHDGVNNNGVHVFSSETSIKSCEIFKNYYQGIYVTEKSKFSIEGCDIYGNGNEKGNYPQVHINKSNGSIIDSKIHDGVDYGIVIVLTPKSPITLTKVSTWNNKTGLKYDYGGDVVIKDCDFKDGSGSLGFFENFKY